MLGGVGGDGGGGGGGDGGGGLYNLLKAFLSFQSDCSPQSTQLWLPCLSILLSFLGQIEKKIKKKLHIKLVESKGKSVLTSYGTRMSNI